MTINKSFSELNLIPRILENIEKLGYKIPTDIQLESIPRVLNSNDLMAIAPTGTGKTASFALPILQKVKAKQVLDAGHRPKALVLTPTRELAIQVFNDFENYGQGLSLRHVLLHGGVSYESQFQKIADGVDIIVSTPGRLRDHLENKKIDLSELNILVLDEADRMLDMGFIEDVSVIIQYLPKKRQTLMFSATFSEEVQRLAKKFLNSPHLINPKLSPEAKPKIHHVIHPVDPEQKILLLLHLIDQNPNQQILVFARTKDRADELAKKITAHDLRCMATHSGRTQAYRTKAMACFKDGRIQVLVATEIAARGIDIEDLPLVINYELPNLAEDYVHRIGRTGRAGAEGRAITLLTQSEIYLLDPIETLLKQSIEQVWVEGFFPKKFDPRAKAAKSTVAIARQGKSKGRKNRYS